MNLWLTAVLLVYAADVASAHQVRVVRYADDRLTGITQVDIVVSTTGDVTRCAIDRPHLQKIAVEGFRGTKVKVTVSERSSSWFHSVLITAQVVAVGSSCVTALATELITHVHGIPEADRDSVAGGWGSLLVGTMTLLREGTMVSSAAGEHNDRVETGVRSQVALIGARIGAVNR